MPTLTTEERIKILSMAICQSNKEKSKETYQQVYANLVALITDKATDSQSPASTGSPQ